MSISKKLQGQLRRKEKKIQQLELERQELDIQIREGHAYIDALEEAMKHLPKDEVDKDSALSLRKGKSIYKVYEILKEGGSPMHITDILVALGKETDKKSQQATGSQLNSYVRTERIFTRPTANTFGLKEWENANVAPTPTEGRQTEWPLAPET